MALFRALMTGHSGACTFHADNEREAAARMSTIMGADVGIKRIDANQMFADAIDLLVQIVIQHDSRRISTISHVNTDLKGGEVSFSPIWKFDVNSNKESPKWEKVGEE
jgi:pilus assembly protein CpaF